MKGTEIKKQKGHGREFGVMQYNELCDLLGIDTEKRIDVYYDAEEEKQRRELLEAGIISQEDADSQREETDIIRERLISAFRSKNLEIITTETGESEIKFKLYDPLKKESGDIFLGELNFKKRYRVRDLNQASKGLKSNDDMGRMTAFLSCLSGVARMTVEQFYNKDKDVLEAYAALFQRAGMGGI